MEQSDIQMSNKTVYSDRLYENQGFAALIDMIVSEHRRVLDVGCGNGANMSLLSARGHLCTGLTLSEVEAKRVRERGHPCQVWDVTADPLPFPEESFDALVFSHVLEHLPWPDEVLRRYQRLLRPGGGVYVALPNVLHLVQRAQFLRGRFRYTETGLMDRTHLRFFDFASARQLVESSGLKVIRHIGIGQCPTGPFREWAPGFSRWVDRWTSRKYPGLFAIHMVVIACRVEQR